MITDARINEGEIYRWFSLFRPNDELVEIRAINHGRTWSGYFKGPESVINALKTSSELLEGNVYQVFNEIDEACYSRPQKDRFLLKATTTSDKDIVARDWVFIDIDPIRPADTNATDEDEQYAIGMARRIVRYLLDEGFNEPVVIASANGAHIYIRCEMLNNDVTDELLKDFTTVLGNLFDDDRIKIDPSINNASRLAKLPGTRSGKGSPDDEKYPQRWCRFLKVPKEIVPTDIAFFQKVASMLPEPPKRSQANNWGREAFDLRAFMQKHGITVKQEIRAAGGTRFILDHCVFDPTHKDKDAMIFQYDNGSIAYKCFHASCSQYTWRDVRLLFEPDAYDNRQELSDLAYKRKLRGRDKAPFVPQKETEEKGPIWLSLRDIPTLDPDSIQSIATGIKGLDDRICGGTILQQLSVMTGRPASGKSTLLNTILLSSVQQGVPTAIFSGELPNRLLKSWVTLPAAGRTWVKPSIRRRDSWYVPKDVEDKIMHWLDGKLFVHNSEYGNEWRQLRDDLKKVVDTGVKNIILDNLMTIDLDNEDDTSKTRAQIGFIKELHDMVRVDDVHIWLVAHPRKQTLFLRYDDISGASEIGNIADNIFIVHRVGQDFENQARNFFPKETVTALLAKHPDNVVEIAKNRIPGTHIGELVGTYFEKESKRMKNEATETFQYAWDTTPVQQAIPTMEEPEPEIMTYHWEREQDDVDF